MKWIAIALIFGICLVASAQGVPDIIKAVSSSASSGDDDPSGEAEVKDSGPSLVAGDRHLGFHRPPRPISHCPAFGFPQSEPTCPGKCSTSYCKFWVTQGYYCGLSFYLAKPIYVGGSYCRYENKKCGSGWFCRCKTRVCWIKLKKLIKHNNNYYIVYVYIKRPCGCRCVG